MKYVLTAGIVSIVLFGCGSGAGGGTGTCDCPGGTCVNNVCCEAARTCGDVCCGVGDVCSFGTCQTPGAECLESAACPEGSYCEFSLGDDMPSQCASGLPTPTGLCLPRPPTCPDGTSPGNPPTCITSCEYRPSVSSFSPELRYAWGDSSGLTDNVMMSPIVIQLDDDSCDGIVNERDIPEIVFTTFTNGNYSDAGIVHAISAASGALAEKWRYTTTDDPPIPGLQLAGGNIDGQPGNEVAACTVSGSVILLSGQGQLLWKSAASVSCGFLSVADVDGDGAVEVITAAALLSGATGQVLVQLPATTYWVAADMTGDSRLELVSPLGVYQADGTLLASTGAWGGLLALGDLNRDGRPELVVPQTAPHSLSIWSYDGVSNQMTLVRSGIDINGTISPTECPEGSEGRVGGGGPATIADFNGDGAPDVGLAGGVGYAVFDGARLMDPAIANADTLMWIRRTVDCSSAGTGSSVFDFEGDGSAEVVYADELFLHVYRGSDGADLAQICNTSGTLSEYPLVADVDNDNQADIVVASNNYAFTCGDGTRTTGIRVFGAAERNWVNTRRVWNQHAYSVTNVTEGGEIPTQQISNWTVPGLNNFRQNIQPAGEFAAPDLVPQFGCTVVGGQVQATIRNVGAAAAAAPIIVHFFAGDPALGGTELPGSPITIARTLFPLDAEVVAIAQPAGAADIFVVVDEDSSNRWNECRVDNNRANFASACVVE